MNPATNKKTVYSFSQLISSQRYCDKTDILNALLDNEKSYTLEETDKIINEFLQGGAY